MSRYPLLPADLAVVHARVRKLLFTLQATWWQARQARHRARLTRLARYMPQANPMTLAVTAKILEQRGLLTLAPRAGPPSSHCYRPQRRTPRASASSG
jgi:hypothetical protein